MAVQHDTKRQAQPSSASSSGHKASIELPVDLAQRFVHQVRRLRWLLTAIVVVLCVFFVSGRINLPEAMFAFVFLTLAALLSGATTAARPGRPRSAVAAKLAAKRMAAPSLEQMISAWPQPVLLIDKHSSIRAINPQASELLDISQTGGPLSFRLRDPDVLSAVQQALTQGVAQTIAIIEKVPAERMLRLHIQPYSAASKRVVSSSMSGVSASATADKVALSTQFVLIVIEDETSAYRTERMRSDFVANASHELRTPLASITGCIETLQGSARNDPAGRERFLAIMTKQAARMTSLIDDLLSLNRIEMQAHRRPTQCVDLTATVREAMDLVRPAAEEAGMALNLAPPTSPATVRGDAEALRQVATNLLENGIKYGASGKRIDVSLGDAVEGGVRMVELRIQDYGPGIAESHIPRLTERFYRAHQDANPLATGTGLGLAIVKHIVARHRGRLIIDSVEGEGACFSIRVPYMTVAAVESDKSENNNKNQSTKLSHE